jgi:stalled ribosome rescue protein Dom34
MEKKQMGIWMDHSIAFLMEVKKNKVVETIVEIEVATLETDYDSGKNEKLEYNKGQQFQANFYKKIIESIKNYQDVILFGPTEAKNELLNILKGDHQYEKINIKIQHSDKMTAFQMHEFVIAYFKN